MGRRTHLRKPLDLVIGGIQVQSATFDLSGDLDAGGQELLALVSRPC